MYGLCYICTQYNLIVNIRMFILQVYHGNIQSYQRSLSYQIEPIVSSTLYPLACAQTISCNKRVLDTGGNFTNFTTSFRLNDSNIVVAIATLHPILLKPFLDIPKHVLGQNNFDLWQKTLKQLEFSYIHHGHSHIGRHLEYLKLLKGYMSTPPQISLCTSQ